MLWFKRNLLFALSLLVVLGFFGYGCYYLYAKFDESSEIQKKVEETDAALKKIFDANTVFPNATNIAILRQQEADLKAFLGNAVKTKTRVEFDSKITPSGFKTLLDNSIAELSKDADKARIPVLQREFTFSAIKPLVSFPEGSVPLLIEQLAEVKTILGILFRSEISSLENIRRSPVCRPDTDALGSPDYHTMTGRTNELTGDVSSFYIVTFQSFSESLAAVLENLQKSPYGLTVRLISVQPGVGPKPGVPPGPGAPPPPPPAPGTPPPQFTRNAPPGGPGGPRPGPGPGGPSTAVRRLDTLADEKSFRVSLLLEISKPGVPAQ